MREKYLCSEYYKRRLYGGRGRFARAVDYLSFRLLLFVLLYLFFSSHFAQIAPRLLLSGMWLLIFCLGMGLIKSIRLESFREKENERLRQAHAREQILFLSAADFAAMVRRYTKARAAAYEDCLILPIQRSEPIGRDMLLGIHRLAKRRGVSKAALFSPAPIAEDAKDLLVRGTLHIVPQGDAVFAAMAKEAGLWLEDGALEGFLLQRLEGEREKRKQRGGPFIAARVRRYLSVGLVLFAASFFVEHSLYYRLMAGLCFSFATLAFFLERTAPAARQAEKA